MTAVAPEIRFCSSADGTRLAYTVAGAGSPLVMAALHNTDADLVAPGPATRHWIDRLCGRHRVLRFDARGCGLSERLPHRLTLQSCVDDFLAVVDAAGFERLSVVALSYGSAVAIPFAAMHPQRVDRLVCYGGAARGRFHRDIDAAQREDLQEVLKLVASGHSDRSEYGASFRRMFYEQFFPDAHAQLLDEIDQIILKRFTGEVAAAYAAAVFNSDFSDEARRLQLPALVLHSRHDRFCAFSEGRHLASLIPNAGFIPVESNHNVPLATDADWPASILAIERFLDADGKTADATRLGEARQRAALTARQLEVLRRVATGQTDKQIARELSLSPRTVEMHVAGAMKALGSKTRAEAVRQASEQGQFRT